MKIADRSYVAIDYSLTLDSGEPVDKSDPGEPLEFVCGMGHMIPGLEKAIMGMEKGQNAKIDVAPEEAYGLPRTELTTELARTNFPKGTELKIGQVYQADGPHGPVSFTVRDLKLETVLADFNHPLAGQRLHFDVTIADVREPTEEEIKCYSEEGCADAGCTGCK